MGPEARLESRCCALAQQAGYMPIKLHGVGLPDRLFITKEWQECIFVEFKAPKGRLSPAQKTMHRRFKKLRHYVYTVRSVDEFKKALMLR